MPNPTLTGAASLAGKDVGGQAATSAAAATPVQSTTGSTGSSAATTISLTLDSAPAPGNTLLAVVATRGTSAGRVSAIAQFPKI